MYRKILLAYDGSEEGRTALLECSDLAALSKAEIHLVAVVPPPAPIMFSEAIAPDMAVMMSDDNRRFEDVLADGVRILRERGYETAGRLARGEPVAEICALARELDADLVVVGHRRAKTWAQRWWRGSVGSNLMDHSPCSVLIAMSHT
jgi:nucleotide-binding universal stress UspA family protein